VEHTLIDSRLSGLVVGLAIALADPTSSQAGFIGTLELLPSGCEQTGHCRLGQDFGYVDPSGTGWQAQKGLLTDGASIPPWARPFIGEPFDKAFIKAAVIHDHYCIRHVHPWRRTHRVFYDALIESDVPAAQAGIMYFAVMVGGPKWAKLIKGKPCPVGTGCINEVDEASLVGGTLALSGTSELLITRPNRYGSASFANTMAKAVPELIAKGNGLTAVEVEALAAKMMDSDFYFKNGDEIGAGVTIKVSQ
jgi:Protein of unknown function (DUF1353)